MDRSTSQGRFFILDAPVASPGTCAICGYGGVGDRKYLDPQLIFEFYGNAIFCDVCVTAMANVFDCLSPAQTRELELRVEEAERQLVQYKAAVLNLENVRGAIAALGASGILASDGSVSDFSSSDADNVLTVSGSDSGSTNREDAESSDEPRSNDVRNSTADEFIDSLGL